MLMPTRVLNTNSRDQSQRKVLTGVGDDKREEEGGQNVKKDLVERSHERGERPDVCGSGHCRL